MRASKSVEITRQKKYDYGLGETSQREKSRLSVKDKVLLEALQRLPSRLAQSPDWMKLAQ
jgi:hypothetical protein